MNGKSHQSGDCDDVVVEAIFGNATCRAELSRPGQAAESDPGTGVDWHSERRPGLSFDTHDSQLCQDRSNDAG